MKIIVCVKQVPDTTGDVELNPNGTLNRASMKTVVNPDDLYAVEQALRLKDVYNCQVTVLTMGPYGAEAMLRELLAMGCDEAVLISSREFGGSDTFATSQIIAAGISVYGLTDETVILCGRQAIDGDTAQVGPQIAEKLDLPQVTCVSAIKWRAGWLNCTREFDAGTEELRVQLPCLLTIVQNRDKPRYMNVRDIMKAYSKPMHMYSYETLRDHPLIEPENIGIKGSPTNIYKTFAPLPKGRKLELFTDDREGCQKWVRQAKEQQII